jgi:N-acyl-phosphatidylethanolamine-hydrolysing phospholipase D
MNKIFLAIISFIILLFFSGCFYFGLLTRSVDDAIFSTPDKIKHKIENPYNKNVSLSALWIGHSSVLLQIYDKMLLFDPFFNTRIEGVFMRKVEPGIDIDKINKLDFIFISHSHLDHFNFFSLDYFEKKYPAVNFVFPYGLEQYLPDYNFNLIRLDDRNVNSRNPVGNSIFIDSIKITPVYAMHTGGRYIFDAYVWKTEGATGYIIKYRDLCIYFAGDTGYDNYAFKKIGDNFKIDVAFIPIGPCRNCDSSGFKYHTTSIEALKLFRDVKASIMVPIHYGALEYFRDSNYPLEILEKILNDEKYGMSDLKNNVRAMKEGEQIILR